VSHQILVSFGGAKQYSFHLAEADIAAVPSSDAQRWLDDEWTRLGCEPVRPTGKVLLLDKVLSLAREAGERHFADNDAWARSYVRNVARLVVRPLIVVDVAENRVG
jgi:hypothetical protein